MKPTKRVITSYRKIKTWIHRGMKLVNTTITWLKRVVNWFYKEWWFVLIPSVFWVFHTFILIQQNISVETSINKFIFLIFQFFGIAIIIFSINSNFKAFDKGEFRLELMKRIKKFPRMRSEQSLLINVSTPSVGVHMRTPSATVHIEYVPQSLEAKIDYLRTKVEELEIEYKEADAEIRSEMDNGFSDINDKNLEIERLLQETESKVEDLITEGWEWEIFGFLIAMHSSVVDFSTSL